MLKRVVDVVFQYNAQKKKKERGTHFVQKSKNKILGSARRINWDFLDQQLKLGVVVFKDYQTLLFLRLALTVFSVSMSFPISFDWLLTAFSYTWLQIFQWNFLVIIVIVHCLDETCGFNSWRSGRGIFFKIWEDGTFVVFYQFLR